MYSRLLKTRQTVVLGHWNSLQALLIDLRGLRLKEVRTSSITSSEFEVEGRSVLLAGHKHQSVMNLPCHLTMDFLSGGFFPKFSAKCTLIHFLQIQGYKTPYLVEWTPLMGLKQYLKKSKYLIRNKKIVIALQKLNVISFKMT